MKTKILTIDGKSKGEMNLPKCFSAEIRKDIIARVLEAKKTKQPYSPSLMAGQKHSASGKLVHRRHVWKSQYGRAISRIPRKIMSRKGSQFNWIGATSPNTRGGRKAHPPKILSMINTQKINKKELRIAFISALSATANKKEVIGKYNRLSEIKDLPLIVESKFVGLKIKDVLLSMKNILGEDLFKLSIKKKSVRSGIGKLRGRKYKSNAGLLFVIGNDEEFKTNAFDVVNVKSLGVVDLAKGGAGRITMYTEKAINEIEEKLTSSPKNQTKKIKEKLK